MAVDFQVGQFVHDYVFDQGWRHHHDPPVEAKGAVGGAAAPALSLVSDHYFGCLRQAHPLLPELDSAGKTLEGSLPIPLNDLSSDAFVGLIGCNGQRHSYPKGPVIELDLGRGYVREIRNRADAAAQVWQRFSTDQAIP